MPLIRVAPSAISGNNAWGMVPSSWRVPGDLDNHGRYHFYFPLSILVHPDDDHPNPISASRYPQRPSTQTLRRSGGLSLGLSVGVVVSEATVAGGGKTADDNAYTNVSVASYLADASSITAPGGLTIKATQNQDASGDETAKAECPQGSVGAALVVGVDATISTASTSGKVLAYTGTMTQLPAGDVSIEATNTTEQSATATGVGAAVGIGAGDVTTNALSNVATAATLGNIKAGSPTRTGALSVAASGTNTNITYAICGSGGIASGGGSFATMSNTSTVSAALEGGTIYAGKVAVTANNSDTYTPFVNSINASFAGGSGATAANTDTVPATTTIADNTIIVATDVVTVTAGTSITEAATDTGAPNATGGAGGFYEGNGAQSTAALNGTATVTLGNNVTIQSGTDPFTNPGGIDVGATTALDCIDMVTLTTGGAVTIPGTKSEIDATLTNTVNIGTNNVLVSMGSIGVGTYSVAVADTSAATTTGGAVSACWADAYSNVTANQNVTVGSGTTMTAVGDISLAAGKTTASVTQNGTITAGIFNNLKIDIPDKQDAPGGTYSQSVTITDSGSSYFPQVNGKSTAPTLTYAYVPPFDPQTFIMTYFPDQSEESKLSSGVASETVGAMALGQLYASGGSVTLNADSLSGTGT